MKTLTDSEIIRQKIRCNRKKADIAEATLRNANRLLRTERRITQDTLVALQDLVGDLFTCLVNIESNAYEAVNRLEELENNL